MLRSWFCSQSARMAQPGWSLTKVLRNNEQKSLLKWILSWEGLKMFADGNIGWAKLVKGPTQGALVGKDQFGNAYYENRDLPYHRSRWVVYKDTFDYNPTQIPPEWHGWVNYINDFPPTSYKYDKPKYLVDAYKTRTGTSMAHNPKGSFLSPLKRSWKKVEPWQPPQSS